MPRRTWTFSRPAALLALCLTATPALSEGDGLTAAYGACMSASGGTTYGMLACVGDEHARQDARLNRVYQELMRALSRERGEALRAAQRLWIRYRDANCDFYYDPQGGTAAGLSGTACLLTETAERAAELERILRMY